MKRYTVAAKQIAILKQALEFYATESSWQTHQVSHDPSAYECPVGEDQGDIARKALKDTK